MHKIETTNINLFTFGPEDQAVGAESTFTTCLKRPTQKIKQKVKKKNKILKKRK